MKVILFSEIIVFQKHVGEGRDLSRWCRARIDPVRTSFSSPLLVGDMQMILTSGPVHNDISATNNGDDADNDDDGGDHEDDEDL